jgi:hypothetical protein
MTRRPLIKFLGILIFISSCSPMQSQGKSSIPTPFMPVQVEPTEITTEPTSLPVAKVWFSAGVPEAIQDVKNYPFTFEVASSSSEAQLIIQPTFDVSTFSIQWIYALVTAFPNVLDNVSRSKLQSVWAGETKQALYLSSDTLSAIEAILGKPGNPDIQIVLPGEIINDLWNSKEAWGIIPFEDLEPRLKVLSLDQDSPLQKNFDPSIYPLTVRFDISGDPILLSQLQQTGGIWQQRTNRNADLLTVLNMTGTTALVRATAYKMETKGIDYPGLLIKEIFMEADLNDVSNEVSFTPDCPYPDPNTASLEFCSKPEYIQLLEWLGVNIVELTGNHMLDYNAQPFRNTLQMYNERNWMIFGGGIDAEAAKQPLLIENHHNRVALIGCNVVGPEVDWAKENWPGAAQCNFEYMTREIRQLKSEGYIVIATLQDQEIYVPNPEPYIREHFLALAAAGADVVQGSQAHFPQSFEFYNQTSTFIHFGLGNLFFDQMDNPVIGTRREFIDRHIFYNGKYISTELITTMLEDYAQPRLMTPEERNAFLQEYFTYSGW